MSRNYKWLLDIIEGHSNDLLSRVIRFGLLLLSIVYRQGIRLRNWAYDQRIFKSHSIALPVISVGNLTVGGTGKTPFVIWLAKFLQDNHEVVILSRGYGSQGDKLNDEGREIQEQVPSVLQIQNQDRVAAAQSIQQTVAVESSTPKVIVLDDGFQHRRLKRNLDIILIDATNPFGKRYLLPRGYLREPLQSVQRAHVAVLTRANLVSQSDRDSIRRHILSLNPNLVWTETQLQANHWIQKNEKSIPFHALKNNRLFAFCGIGNPDGFFRTLASESFNLVDTLTFPDHHLYSKSDLAQIVQQAENSQCDAIVCTRKDYVKIDKSFQCSTPLYALATEVQFRSGLDNFAALINRTLLEVNRTLSKVENPR